jgi:hypothetical protein
MQINLVTSNTLVVFSALFDVQTVKTLPLQFDVQTARTLSLQFSLFRHNLFKYLVKVARFLVSLWHFPVNVTVVLRTLPDEDLAWLTRELYSNSCGHTSCNTCTKTLVVTSVALRVSATAYEVLSLYTDFKCCIDWRRPEIYFLFNFLPPKLLVHNSSYT